MRDVNMTPIRSIDRAIDILQAFTIENSSLKTEEISKLTNIPHSTTYRILCTLERRGLVQFDEKSGTYQPGLRLLEFSYILSSNLDVKKEAEELLIDLHQKTNQTVLMAVRDGNEIIYVFRKENYEGLKVSSVVGQRQPFMFGILGPVLLAYLPEEEIDSILDIPIPQHTPYTVKDKTVIKQRLDQIKVDRLYSESNETTIGVTGVGSPVFDSTGAAIAAIGVVGPAIQLDDQLEEVKPLVLETANNISVKMGYFPKSTERSNF